jgi:hypothetical protein
MPDHILAFVGVVGFFLPLGERRLCAHGVPVLIKILRCGNSFLSAILRKVRVPRVSTCSLVFVGVVFECPVFSGRGGVAGLWNMANA